MPTLTIPEQLRATAQRMHKHNGSFICHELSRVVTNDAGQTVYCPGFSEALNFSALRFLKELGMPLDGGGFQSRSQHGECARAQDDADRIPHQEGVETRAAWCEFAACLAEEWGITTHYPRPPSGNTFQAVPLIDRAAIEVTR